MGNQQQFVTGNQLSGSVGDDVLAVATDIDDQDAARKTFPEWTKKIIDYLTDIKSSTQK